ncbi:MAG: HU family DNA-binding protein [Clostridia bacterium]|nr:HU family DNA-binding protein [Clostridia bacterium]
MNKTELVKAIAADAGLSNVAAEKALSATIAAITKALAAGDKVSVLGFGTFEVRERGARTGLNPRTGEKLEIAATKVPAFKAGQALKNAVAK